jgi:hypothetical protein
MNSAKSIYKVIIPLLLVAAIYFSWVNHQWPTIVASDGKGYYAYLPALINFQDLTWSFYKSVLKQLPSDYQESFLFVMDGKLVNKYPVGMALLIAPFYLLAHLFALLLNYPLSGYSQPYFAAVSFSALFYLLTGIYFLQKIFEKYDFGIKTFITAVLILSFGTNLLNYVANEPSMTHVYSFALISMWMYSSYRWICEEKSSYFLLVALLTGLIYLVRPVNLLVVLSLPIVAGDFRKIGNALKILFLDKRKYLFAGGIILLSIVSVQSLLWYLQNGKIWNDTYTNESFNWSHPEIIKGLFGYRKGWVLYTPVVVLLFCSWFFHLIRKDWGRLLSSLTFWVVLVYITTSWYNWYYGGSFGQRPFIDYYALLVFSIAPFISKTQEHSYRYVFNVFIALCIVLNLVQLYQYDKNIIHYDSMNKEVYWKVFFKTSSKYQWLASKNTRSVVPSIIRSSTTDSLFNDFSWPPPGWANSRYDHDGDALSGTRSVLLTKEKPFTPQAEILLKDSLYKNRKFFFRGWLYGPDLNSCNLVLTMTDAGRVEYVHLEQPVKLQLTGRQFSGWHEFIWNIALPYSPMCDNGWLKIYAISSNVLPVHADDFLVAIYK